MDSGWQVRPVKVAWQGCDRVEVSTHCLSFIDIRIPWSKERCPWELVWTGKVGQKISMVIAASDVEESWSPFSGVLIHPPQQ